MVYDVNLQEQHASNLFDLRGVVAVVTGGGSVSLSFTFHINFRLTVGIMIMAGYRANDRLNLVNQRRNSLHHWTGAIKFR